MNKYPVFDAATRANPQAIYNVLREEEPVYRAIGPLSGRPFWFITRYEDCVTILKDPRVGKEFWNKLPTGVAYWEPDDRSTSVDKHLLNIDPPDHTRLRGLVHKAFTPRMVENLRDRIQTIADDLLDNFPAEDADLIEHYAFPLPMTVIAELLGVPFADRDKFRHWSKTYLFGHDVAETNRTVQEFGEYFLNMFILRREDPRDDLISALVAVEDEGDKLSPSELMGMVFLLLIAGHETTVNLIGNGTLALLQHPDQMQKLQDDPSLIKSAVEEMLRYNGPVETTTLRWAFEDITIAGQEIPIGDVVIASLIGANHDPAVFDNPEEFDITREPNRHIAFGHGIHYCVGAPLARLEGVVAIQSLIQRFPDLQLAVAPDELQWSKSILLHGMQAMPVRARAKSAIR